MPSRLCDSACAHVDTVAIKVGIALVGTGCLLLALAHAASPNRRYYSGSYTCRLACDSACVHVDTVAIEVGIALVGTVCLFARPRLYMTELPLVPW